MKYLFLIFFFLMCSCGTVKEIAGPNPDEKLAAENNLLKNRMSLIERENSVIKIENIDEKRNVKNLAAEKERLESEIVQLNKKYLDEKQVMEKQYQNLMDKNKILEIESGEKIKKLSQLNKQLEEKMVLEIKKLYATLNQKEKDFNTQKMLMKKDFAEKEAVFLKASEVFRENILVLNKDLETSRQKYAELEKDYKSLELENTALKQKDLQTALFLKQNNEELSRLNQEKNVLVKKMSDLETLMTALKQNEQKNTDLIKQSAEELAKAGKEKDLLLKKTADLESLTVSFKQNDEKNKLSLKQSQEDLEKSRKEKEQQAKRIQELEKEVQSLKKEIEIVRSQNEKQTAQLKAKLEESQKKEAGK